MSLLTEEQREELKTAGIKSAHVNETCIGCSACVAISPEVFELDDDGLSVVIKCDNYDDK
jgi:ferredoxin